MNFVLKLLTNRNFVLIMAVVFGLTLHHGATLLKPFTIYILAVVMIFSTTGIRLQHLKPVNRTIKIMAYATFLNFFVFGAVLLVAAWFFAPEKLFPGFVVIAATPPGVAIIPFSVVLKGNPNYSIIGFIGVFLASIVITPAVITLFSNSTGVVPVDIIVLMLKVIILPLLLSRLLLHRKVLPWVEKSRGHIVNWGFALIIYTAVGLNRDFFFGDYQLVLLSSLVLFLAIFMLGSLYEAGSLFFRRPYPTVLSEILMLTIKSSGFAVVTALTLFGEQAAIPSAVMSIFVLLYLLTHNLRYSLRKRKKTAKEAVIGTPKTQ